MTPVGIGVHVLSLILWGMLFSVAAGRRRGALLWVGAVLFAVVVAAIDFLLLPARLSPGFETVLARGEIIVVYALMAATMGMAAGSLREN